MALKIYRESDLAYAAGLIDGEGTVGLYKVAAKAEKTVRNHAVVKASMTDKEPLIFLRDILDGSIQFDKIPNQRLTVQFIKPYHHWNLMQLKALRACLLILPYMKIPAKRSGAEAIIEHYRTHEGIRSMKYRFRQEADRVFSEVRKLGVR